MPELPIFKDKSGEIAINVCVKSYEHNSDLNELP